MQICSAKIIAETDKFFYKKYNYKPVSYTHLTLPTKLEV